MPIQARLIDVVNKIKSLIRFRKMRKEPRASYFETTGELEMEKYGPSHGGSWSLATRIGPRSASAAIWTHDISPFWLLGQNQHKNTKFLTFFNKTKFISVHFNS